MKCTVYLQFRTNNKVNSKEVIIGDIADVLCTDKNVLARIKSIKLLKIKKSRKIRVCFSVMRVIKLINDIYPDVEICNIGEKDFIIEYEEPKTKNKIVSIVLSVVAFLITFTGSAYAVMAYNNDVGTNEIFEKIYTCFGMKEYSDYNIIEIAYAIGMFLGIMVFYNHFMRFKFTDDPTPIEVEMDKCGKDIDNALIENSSENNTEKTSSQETDNVV